MLWIIDGNNVYGSRPDGWWNDRDAAASRFTQRVAEWCRTHGDHVTVVFDAPMADAVACLAGGNLDVVEAHRRGRNGADDEIVDLIGSLDAGGDDGTASDLTVVTSDRGLRARLPADATVLGVGRFRALVGY
ncbi:MAG: RNA-binding protein [Ilumatobacteraceae bacterium]